MKLINPLTDIKQSDLPLFILTDDLRSFFSWGIRNHTKGSYSHAMIMVKPGKVANQGWTYKEVPIDIYMTERYRIKFWRYDKLTKEDKARIIEAVEKDLKQSWFRKSYDWLGIVGQLFKIRWFNNPLKNYCSERMAKYARMILAIKHHIFKHPSPADLNRIFRNIIDMKIFGYWFED